jgi:hypothetical protein
MIATTIISSISVKPFWIFLIKTSCSWLHKTIGRNGAPRPALKAHGVPAEREDKVLNRLVK